MRRALLVVLVACRSHFDPLVDTDDGGVPASEIEVAVVGHGIALVAGQPPCTSTCRYTTGPLDITPQAGEAWELEAFGGACTGQGACTVPLGTRVTLTFRKAPITANIAFVSSAISPRTGLASIDALCSNLAGTAGLPGTYVALVSTSTVDARDRVGSARGWVRVDGLPVFDTMADLDSNVRPRAVTLDEGGNVTPLTFVNTGSTSAGIKTANHCSDWTVTTGMADCGRPSFTDGYTMSNTVTSCGNLGPVYCLETDRNTAVSLQPPRPAAGRYVFLSSGYAVGGGVAGADALCQNEAAAASLPGMYRAMIATTTETAAQRVGGVSGLWRRTDGIAVTFEGLDAPSLDAAILLDATGAQFVIIGPNWLGANDIDQLATTNNCADWTAPAALAPRIADPVSTLAMHQTRTLADCSGSWTVMCGQLP